MATQRPKTHLRAATNRSAPASSCAGSHRLKQLGERRPLSQRVNRHLIAVDATALGNKNCLTPFGTGDPRKRHSSYCDVASRSGRISELRSEGPQTGLVVMPANEDFDEDFRPDDFLIEGTDNGQVRLVWERDSGERRTVVLERSQVPAVLHELQKQTARATSASNDPLALLSETDALVTGLGFGPQADHFRLTAFVDLAKHDEGFAISLLLSEADLEKCVSAMTQWLEQQPEEG